MLQLVLLLAALILFIIAAAGVASRFNLIAAGLACATLAFLIPMIGR